MNHQKTHHALSNSRIKIAYYFLFLISAILSTGCAKSPAEQCLESFRDDLVSPRSAVAVKIIDGNLTYLAKNRSGTEIQGKAICEQVGEKWVRDSSAEYIEILKFVANSLELNNKCRSDGHPRSYCEMMYQTVTPDIARIKLGYN